MSLKDTILAVKDNTLQSLVIEEWGVTVYLRKWTARERSQLQDWWGKNSSLEELSARVAVLSICDESGKRQFTLDDLQPLLDKSGTALESVTLKALKINGLSKETIDEAKKN